MRLACSVATILTLLAAPAFAADGHVAPSTLANMGLGSAKTISDQEGMAIRGMSSGNVAMGLSLVSGLLIDPVTKSFVYAADANSAAASAENGGLQVFTVSSAKEHSSIGISLNVSTPISSFNGFIFGGAGGSSTGFSR